MDENFATAFSARLQELTAELRFYHKPTGESMAPQIFQTMLPVKTRDHLDGEHFPLICWTFYGGTITHLEPSTFKVCVDCAIRVDEGSGSSLEQIVSGSQGINSLLQVLRGLAGRRRFGCYKLQLPFRYIIGSDEKGHEGRQPHPFYYLRLDLSFTSVINTRR